MTCNKSPFSGLINQFAVKYQIQLLIARALKRLFEIELSAEEIEVKHPQKEKFGDYSTNIGMVLAKRLKKSPREVAALLEKSIGEGEELEGVLESVEAAGEGFLNFKLSRRWLIKQLKEVIERGDKFGSTQLGKGKCEMVEFCQANTNKHFHVGHLRNISLGESLCRLMEFNGFKVWRTNYQGDIGLHVAKTIWAILKDGQEDKIDQLLGEELMDFLSGIYVKGASAYREDENAREEIDDLNKRIYEAREKREGELYDLWEKMRRKALDYFDVLYKLLGTHFDKLYFDSDVVAGREDVLEGLKQGVFEESDGAIIFRGEKYGLHTRVFINSRGVPTYDAKDIRLAKIKAEDFNFEHSILVTAEEHKEYWRVIFKVLELLKIINRGSYFHRTYGFVNLGREGRTMKMSSRLGNVVTLVDLIREAELRIRGYLDENRKKYTSEQVMNIAEKVAVGALKYSMLKIEPEKSIAFNLDKSVSFEGDSAPYLQYTYARARSVLRKGFAGDAAANFSLRFCSHTIERAVNCVVTEEADALLRAFYKFPEVVNDATRFLEPHRLCPFLFGLAQKFNVFYQKVPVLKAEDKELRDFRLLLTEVASQILKNGLYLLGIEVLEEM